MSIYRYTDGRVANTGLFVYLLLGLGLALAGLLQTETTINILATLLLAHILVLCAYLAHECMHNTIFRRPEHNRQLGRALCWLLGATYLPYEELRNKHMRHHSERADIVAVDLRSWLQRRKSVRQPVALLQWLYIPALEIVSHLLDVVAAFMLPQRARYRTHSVVALCSRLLFFLLLGWLHWPLLVGYVLAWCICIAVLGFMDAYQHDYEIYTSLEQSRLQGRRDRHYEETHTYTNLLSERWPLLNLLVLNFCYHNVHHWKSGEPWHRLPRLHRQRYPQSCPQVVPLDQQLQRFHHYRLDRAYPLGPGSVDAGTQGAAGVSFLVGV